MDQFSPIFSRFTLSARVFYTGTLCGATQFEKRPGIGHLHLLHKGCLTVSKPNILKSSVSKQAISKQGIQSIEVTEPSVIFYPRPFEHRFRAKRQQGAELVCAEIDFGVGMGNPLVSSLPEVMIIPLQKITGLKTLLELLFDEAFANRYGRQAAVDRLTEYFLVLLLRYAIDTNLISVGVFAGLSDPRLAKAINAMHEKPEYLWSLENLADKANMSRTRFAVNFKQIVGVTPLDYLTGWRVSVAQTLLKRGQPLKMVAPNVGYGSAIALTRVFNKRVGMSPVKWLESLIV